ncbi:9876_t:CDS:2, partial [Cetraspora pellucida]
SNFSKTQNQVCENWKLEYRIQCWAIGLTLSTGPINWNIELINPDFEIQNQNWTNGKGIKK